MRTFLHHVNIENSIQQKYVWFFRLLYFFFKLYFIISFSPLVLTIIYVLYICPSLLTYIILLEDFRNKLYIVYFKYCIFILISLYQANVLKQDTLKNNPIITSDVRFAIKEHAFFQSPNVN